ncbi:uncharacterized protein LOC105253088 [Camponotus floridanus]|uniref:uncharacterized protein LOC105253088 n=1 Tax=Camponotus floridanus TaxID=104421 RepID=UPI000DC6B872|nr:uncharacterized protein LOC105253088 [Camponotus floridanus]
MQNHIFNKKKASVTSRIQPTKKTKGTFDETIFLKEEQASIDIRPRKGTENILAHFNKEANDTITKIMPKQAIPERLYNKSFSRTWLQTSIVEYIWEINCVMTVFKIEKELFSAMFPETSLYRIKLTIDIDTSEVMKSTLRFFLLTGTNFQGVCDVGIVSSSDFRKIKCKSTSGLISNMTLLYETTIESLQSYITNNNLVMYFEIEFAHLFVTESMYVDMMPSSTILYKQFNSEQSNLINLKAKDKELITFKIKEEHYSFPKKALYAINSKYFKNIFDMLENKKDLSYEIEIGEMPIPFKQMLSFILFGLLPDPLNYHMLRDLLIMAHKYDVQTLKILCESYLIHMINIENSIDLIQLALTYNAKSLGKHTSLFIKLYLKEVVRINEFQRLSQNDLDKIFKLVYDINLPLDIKSLLC